MLSEERKKKYEDLELRIGNTPLVEYDGKVPNGNRIWIKRECDNPFGSHYDRVFLALFRHFEESRKIKQRDKVLETTSGTAGASFAGIGQELGFECHVAMPKGTDRAITDKIRSYRATLYFTPESDYIAGFPNWLKNFLPDHKDFTFLNHSMGPRKGPAYSTNKTTLDALEAIAREVLEQVPDFDIYIPACGNGSSIIGPGRYFKKQRPEIRIVPFESAQSGVLFEEKFPGEYKRRFGIDIGALPRHRLRGTSFPGIDFPHIKTAVRDGIVDDVLLVSDREVDNNCFRATRRLDFRDLPHWDDPTFKYGDLGRTGRAGLACAMKLAESVRDKDILIIAYDTARNYDY